VLREARRPHDAEGVLADASVNINAFLDPATAAAYPLPLASPASSTVHGDPNSPPTIALDGEWIHFRGAVIIPTTAPQMFWDGCISQALSTLGVQTVGSFVHDFLVVCREHTDSVAQGGGSEPARPTLVHAAVVRAASDGSLSYLGLARHTNYLASLSPSAHSAPHILSLDGIRLKRTRRRGEALSPSLFLGPGVAPPRPPERSGGLVWDPSPRPVASPLQGNLQPPPEWQCQRCTFINTSRRRCRMCETPWTPPPPPPPHSQQGQRRAFRAAGAVEHAGWCLLYGSVFKRRVEGQQAAAAAAVWTPGDVVGRLAKPLRPRQRHSIAVLAGGAATWEAVARGLRSESNSGIPPQFDFRTRANRNGGRGRFVDPDRF
jgi:hypothetical protein